MPEYRISAGVIPFRESNNSSNLYLLLHYPQGHWGFPKGHLESNETRLEAASRELEEETGLTDISVFENFSECVHYCYKLQGNFIQKTVHFFAGLTKKTKISLSDEHQNFAWVSHNNVHNRLTYDNEKKLFQKWISFNT